MTEKRISIPVFLITVAAGFFSAAPAHANFFLSLGGGMSQGKGPHFENIEYRPMLIAIEIFKDLKMVELGLAADYNILKSKATQDSGYFASGSALLRLNWFAAYTTPFFDIKLGGGRGNLHGVENTTHYLAGAGFGIAFNIVPNLAEFRIRSGAKALARWPSPSIKNGFYLFDASASFVLSL